MGAKPGPVVLAQDPLQALAAVRRPIAAGSTAARWRGDGDRAMLFGPMNSGLAFAITSLLSTALGVALMQQPAAAGSSVAAAAEAFIAALGPELRSKALAPFADPTRTDWHYVPRDYPGVAFGELDAAAMQKAKALLHTVLSDQGMQKVEAIVALEDVLHDLEAARGANGPVRDPRRYWLQVFGTPSRTETFAFRLQGHHVSLHFTVTAGALLAATPTFFGSNPHEVPSGPHRGDRVLGRAEDLARGLLATLTPAQLARAHFADTAPADVLAGPGLATAAAIGAPRGLPASQLDAMQQELLWRLVREFVDDHEGAFAAATMQRITATGRDALHFGWAGSTQRGQGHYFCVQGPTLLLEYDNTQNDANHVHALYRDLQRDFGGDPLREHLHRDHAAAKR